MLLRPLAHAMNLKRFPIHADSYMYMRSVLRRRDPIQYCSRLCRNFICCATEGPVLAVGMYIALLFFRDLQRGNLGEIENLHSRKKCGIKIPHLMWMVIYAHPLCTYILLNVYVLCIRNFLHKKVWMFLAG